MHTIKLIVTCFCFYVKKSFYRVMKRGRVEKKSQFMCHKIRIDFVIIYGGVTMEEFSENFKLKMNRVFREQAGIKNIPHPEVDNLYERIRSSIVRAVLLLVHRIRKRNK